MILMKYPNQFRGRKGRRHGLKRKLKKQKEETELRSSVPLSSVQFS